MTVHKQTRLFINRGHGPQITLCFFNSSDSHCQREILDKKTSVDLEDHKASDSDSNISLFCYGFRYASSNPVF